MGYLICTRVVQVNILTYSENDVTFSIMQHAPLALKGIYTTYRND